MFLGNLLQKDLLLRLTQETVDFFWQTYKANIKVLLQQDYGPMVHIGKRYGRPPGECVGTDIYLDNTTYNIFGESGREFQALLLHELTHSLANSNGKSGTYVDPGGKGDSYLALLQRINKDFALTIGVGHAIEAEFYQFGEVLTLFIPRR